jgi:hypothetical protein
MDILKVLHRKIDIVGTWCCFITSSRGVHQREDDGAAVEREIIIADDFKDLVSISSQMDRSHASYDCLKVRLHQISEDHDGQLIVNVSRDM